MTSREIVLKFPVLHSAQQIVRASPARYRVLACGRRWGKTLTITDEGVECLARGQRVGYFNLSYKQGKEVWEAFKRLCAPIVRHKDEGERRIETITGGVLDMWSLDNEKTAENALGRKYDIIMIDEAARVPNLLTVWDKTLSPMLMDTQGRAFFASSPNGFNDFHTFFKRGYDPLYPDWQSFHYPTSENPHIKPEEIEKQRKEKTDQAFRQEVLAEFIADGAGVFRGLSQVLTAPMDAAPVAGQRYVIGVDWGKQNDFTVIVVMDVLHRCVVAMERFNRIEWHFQRERLKLMIDTWKPHMVLIEENSIGGPNIEELHRAGIRVTPFTTSGISKPPLIENLALAIEKREIGLIPDAVLMNEMQAYTMKRTATGHWTYNAPSGGHDDTVMALALAVRGVPAQSNNSCSFVADGLPRMRTNNVLSGFSSRLGRLMTAVSTGIQTAVRTYRQQDYVPLAELGYDTYEARMARYWRYAMYRDNTVFSIVNNYAMTQKAQHNLYKHIRGIYNPVSRLVNLEIAKVYGGGIGWQTVLRTGAIPIVGADEQLLEAIKIVLKWSNFGAAKSLYVRNGATYGDSFLKVIDDTAHRKVRLEVLDPRKVKHLRRDSVGNITEICIEYSDTDDNGSYTYREEISKESIATFRDDAPHAFNDMGLTEWANPYGFVPVRQVQHKDMGLSFGTTSFADSLSKIDELNDLASNAHDAIRKIVNPIWAVSGTYQLPTAALDATTDARDKTPFITLPAGSTMTPMIAPLDIASAIATMDKLTVELEHDMPQLSLQKIRDGGGNASGVAIVNSYSDASDLIIETQGNYDAGLIAALQMAITIGALNDY